MSDSCVSNAAQLGSTFSVEKPFSAEKPICATCLKSVGAPIRDLSIFPLLFDPPNLLPAFFFLLDEAFANF